MIGDKLLLFLKHSGRQKPPTIIYESVTDIHLLKKPEAVNLFLTHIFRDVSSVSSIYI